MLSRLRGKFVDLDAQIGFAIVAGIAMLKWALERMLARQEELEELHAETRFRVFALETLLEANGILAEVPTSAPLEELRDELGIEPPEAQVEIETPEEERNL